MTPERLTPEELAVHIAQLHPSVRANFVYLPDTHAASHEEIQAAFPIPAERIQNFYRQWREAIRIQAESESA